MKFRFKSIWVWVLAVIGLVLVADFAMSKILVKGVNDFYGLNCHSEVLLVGHSHLMLATDKERLERETGLSVSKYTREGVNVSDRQVMVQQFLDSPYSDSLKVCLYGVDLATFTGEGLSQNSYKLFYPFMDDPKVDAYVKSQAPAKDYWTHKLFRVTRFSDDAVKNGSMRGWRSDWSNRKNGKVDVDAYRKLLEKGKERNIKMNGDLMRQFVETVDTLRAHDVKVVLVNAPTLDLLNEYEPEKYRRIMEWFAEFAAGREGVEFWDFNPEFAGRHELFHDRLHLNADGQREVTGEIVGRLRAMGVCRK